MFKLSEMLKGSTHKGALSQALSNELKRRALLTPEGERKGFSQVEIEIATMAKMTGPRAQSPSWACVRKTVHRIRTGQSTKGSWRRWPRVKKEELEDVA